jgi:hypothetical protein
MKRPTLKTPQLKRPQLKTPQIVDDVYRDLRDRRLLPVVFLLLVAIVAVPIALSVSSSPPAPAPAAGMVPAASPEAQAAVLAENPGLRNYRERLDSLKAKNPFNQLFESSGLEASTVNDVPTASAPTGTGSSTTAPTDPGTGGSVSTATPADTAPSSSTDTTTPPSDAGGTGSELQFFAPRADVLYGPQGNVKKHKLKLLDVLNPVGAFGGVSEDSKQALFVLSTDVIGVPGEGQCAPSPDECEFLALREGHAVDILYQPAGTPTPTVYKLKIERIKMVPIEDDPTSPEGRASGAILSG